MTWSFRCGTKRDHESDANSETRGRSGRRGDSDCCWLHCDFFVFSADLETALDRWSSSAHMNPEMISLHSARARFSRRDWFATARISGIGCALLSLAGCVVATDRPRRGAVVVAPAPAVVVVEQPRVVEKVVVVVREAPPPLRKEVIVERDRPSKAHLWITGHWRHDGRVYIWVPGHWEMPPRPRAVWVEPRWEKRDGVYIHIEGIWR